MKSLIFLLIISAKYGFALECQDPDNTDYCVQVGYNRDVLPPNPPLNVTMNLVVSEVSNVDDSSLSVSLRLIFYVFWNDSRVVRLKQGDRNMHLGLANIEKYFLPDFYIYDLLDFKQSAFANDLKALLITPKGEIWFYSEGTVSIACQMNFKRYPYDSHRCKYLMGSTGYPDSLMRFDSSISYSSDSQRPLQYSVSIEELTDAEKLTVYASGNYSVAGFWVKLDRVILGHLLQIIMPSAMFVIVSWISFLMPLNGGERAGLLVTLFLVLVSMFLTVVTTAPKAGTLTAMETWVVGCLVFVFFALIEYGLVLKVMSESKNKATEIEGEAKVKRRHRTVIKALRVWQNKTSNEDRGSNALDVTQGGEAYSVVDPNKADTAEDVEEEAQTKSHKLDKIALIVLPILFLIFNLFYWTFYLA